MSADKRVRIALVGNPNSGKSSLFNHLTGLNQKVGNFPGVTVDKRSGTLHLSSGALAEIIDLPGAYSIYPRSLDERIVAETLLDHRTGHLPDLVVVVADATNLKRGLLLLTQIIDLGLPVILVLNMMDLAAKAGVSYDFNALSNKLKVPVIPMNARNGAGIEALKKCLEQPIQAPSQAIFKVWPESLKAVKAVQEQLGIARDYEAYLYLEQPGSLDFLSEAKKEAVEGIRREHGFVPGKFQGAETIQRYGFIQDLMAETTSKIEMTSWKKNSAMLDKVLTHKVWGYLIFFGILFLIFQSIFAWASIPMNFIDGLFADLSTYLTNHLPPGPATSLLAEGIVPGIGGIIIFVPQIAILFAFIAMLEETGYMARVVFLMDKIMRKFGLNGKSVVPLISGVACAIPAIMASRTIDNWKERTITILVTPLISCSARIPVFTILVALIVPEERLFGFFNLQGLVLMGLYLLGLVAALLSAMLMKMFIRIKERSFLIMELPTYRWPKWSNVGYTIVEKTKAFVFEAGKIILAISIVLWVLASFGPGQHLENAEAEVRTLNEGKSLSESELANQVAAYKLEHSYAGAIGKSIEPLIRPLGYDWKIGIALITSFAAREVFVGTMATIYSMGSVSGEDSTPIIKRMEEEINPETGEKRFTPAVGFSLLIFYTFAMQCMSTLAVVYRETKGWRWPIVQLVYMSVLAYLSALATYHLFL